MKKKALKTAHIKPRNWVAMDPLMHKGCVHGKTNKAKRKKDNQRFNANMQRGVFEKVVNDYFLKNIVLQFKTTNRGCNSIGRVSDFYSERWGFEALHPHQFYGGRNSTGRVSDCESECCGFESRRSPQLLNLNIGSK